MKPFLRLILILTGMKAYNVFAEETVTNEWGPITNNVQMAIKIKDNLDGIKTNQPFSLTILITNISTNETFYTERISPGWDDDFTFEVISPSGKDLSPRASLHSGYSTEQRRWRAIEEERRLPPFIFTLGRGPIDPIDPQKAMSTEYNISDFCKFDEIGKYKVVATDTIYELATHQSLKVVSDPLYMTFVPGFWKDTNIINTYFNFPE